MAFVEGTRSFKGEKAYTRAQALQHFRDAESMTHKPFIYLSAGVSNPVFIETLELAGESGTKFNGVLCGRATWKDGIAVYAKQGAKAFKDWLETTGWDKNSPPPALPNEVVMKTREKYLEAHERLTGLPLAESVSREPASGKKGTYS